MDKEIIDRILQIEANVRFWRNAHLSLQERHYKLLDEFNKTKR